MVTTMGHYLFQVTTHEIHKLVSNQEETDSDIIFILHFAHVISPTIFLDVGTRKHCQIVNVSELAEIKGADYCIMVLGLTYPREKTLPVQYVKGNRKVGPLKKLLTYPKYHGAFSTILSM